MIALRKRHAADVCLNFPRDAAQIAPFNVHAHIDSARCVFVLYDVRGRNNTGIENIGQWDVCSGGSVDSQLSERVNIAANFWFSPDSDIKDLLILVYFSNLRSTQIGIDRTPDFPGIQAEACCNLLPNP